jgi:hypothetical protein
MLKAENLLPGVRIAVQQRKWMCVDADGCYTLWFVKAIDEAIVEEFRLAPRLVLIASAEDGPCFGGKFVIDEANQHYWIFAGMCQRCVFRYLSYALKLGDTFSLAAESIDFMHFVGFKYTIQRGGEVGISRFLPMGAVDIAKLGPFAAELNVPTVEIPWLAVKDDRLPPMLSRRSREEHRAIIHQPQIRLAIASSEVVHAFSEGARYSSSDPSAVLDPGSLDLWALLPALEREQPNWFWRRAFPERDQAESSERVREFMDMIGQFDNASRMYPQIEVMWRPIYRGTMKTAAVEKKLMAIAKRQFEERRRAKGEKQNQKGK